MGEQSERDTYRGYTIEIPWCLFINFFAYLYGMCALIFARATNWRASIASKTLTGVTQLKIGDMSLFIYVCGRTYVILYFDPRVFLCSLCVRPHPKLH